MKCLGEGAAAGRKDEVDRKTVEVSHILAIKRPPSI